MKTSAVYPKGLVETLLAFTIYEDGILLIRNDAPMLDNRQCEQVFIRVLIRF